MKKQLLAFAAAIGMVTVGGSAHALLVAGWDFSQYLGDGTYVVDDGSLFEFVDTLPANYSARVGGAQTVTGLPGIGPLAAPYGTMYVDGRFGSTAQPVGSGAETLLPSAAFGSLAGNVQRPFLSDGLPFFGALNELVIEGQTNAVDLAMTALGSSSVVFAATPDLAGFDWALSFGGRTQSGNASVAIEFSTDGIDFQDLGAIALNAVDTTFEVPLAAAQTSQAFVRMTFTVDGAASAPLLDNVAITATLVPEPGTALLLLGGLAGMTVYGRRSA